MAYQVENLSKPTLEKLFYVLGQIKQKSEIRNRKKFLGIRIEESEKITFGDYRCVILNLIRDGVISDNIFSAITELFWQIYIINIDTPFFDFYDRVNLQLSKISDSGATQEIKSNNLTFNIKNSVLHFMGYKIPISLKNDTNNAHTVLEHIFNNKEGIKAISPYMEICEDTFKDPYIKDDKYWRRFYRACEDIQKKVNGITGINDFLLFTSGTKGEVQINPKYLK